MTLAHVTLVVPEYDEAIAYFTRIFGFCLREDRYLPAEEKRWVVIAPTADSPVGIVLGRATTAQQRDRIGDQTGGRVFLFLHSDDIAADLASLRGRGVKIVRPVVGARALFCPCPGIL
jgi:catechol 2,3-dioxygenase-like lactoylglutathione lyase family enzyme